MSAYAVFANYPIRGIIRSKRKEIEDNCIK